MGLRDWVFGRDESALDAANDLRGEATSNPDEVDVEALVSLYAETDQHDVARAASKGIEALARQRADRLIDYVPELVDAIDIMDGAGAKQRGLVARAVAEAATVDPDAVAAEADAIIATLERELDADDEVGNGRHLDEQKGVALVEAIAEAEISEAEPVVDRLRKHSDPAVSDAARDALWKI